VQLSLNLGLIDSLLLLSDLEVILMLLLGSLVLGLALVLGHLLYLEVQLLFLFAKTLKLRLLSEILFDSPCEIFEFQFYLQLLHDLRVALDKVILVFSDLTLIAFDIWVILELTTQFSCRLLQIFSDGLD